MQNPPSLKFSFRIRTRGGSVVENLSILGKDRDEAERKLRQIYLGCFVLESKEQTHKALRSGPVNYEDVVDLIVGA